MEGIYGGEKALKKAEMLLFMMPNGIQSISADISGLVQTSLNLGILRTEGREVELDYSVRSSVMSEKEMIIDKVCLLLESQGGKWDISGDYPAWEFKQNSPLREKMVKVYEEMYGKSPELKRFMPVWNAEYLQESCRDLIVYPSALI